MEIEFDTTRERKSLVNIGNCGEYIVAAELERRDFTAAVPMSNSPDFDILAVSRKDSHKQFAIQVKTIHGSKNEWTLSVKNETLVEENIFYVFVRLNELDAPDYFIVPSCEVAKTIQVGHKTWLETPGKNGQKHNDNTMRKYKIPNESPYKNNWDLLI